MTEVTEKKESAAEQPFAAANNNEPGSVKRGSVSTIVAVTALMVASGAFIAGYNVWQQLNQKQTALEKRFTAEDQTIIALQSTSQDVKNNAQSLQQQLTTLDEQTKSEVNQLKQHGSTVDEHLTDLNQRLQEKRGSEWLVVEARHLIGIANYQAQLNYDVKAALSALESADQRLREADDPALLKARQALSDEITALRGVATIDTPGIALLLSQLEQQVAALPLASEEEARLPAATDNSAKKEPSALERFFLKVWSDIKGLVTIRHNTGPKGSPLMTPDQRLYLQQNLRLKLESARLALLQRDTKTFRDTITTTRQWLEQYCDTKAPATASMLTNLSPYTTLELQPTLPDISNALRLLDSWQEHRPNQIKGHTKVEAPLKKGTAAL